MGYLGQEICIFSVFKDTVYFTAYIALNGVINIALSIGKDSEGSSHVLIAVISMQLPGGNENNHKIVSMCNHCSGLDSNLTLPKDKPRTFNYVNLFGS
jgi:hypothetical protein